MIKLFFLIPEKQADGHSAEQAVELAADVVRFCDHEDYDGYIDKQRLKEYRQSLDTHEDRQALRLRMQPLLECDDYTTSPVVNPDELAHIEHEAYGDIAARCVGAAAGHRCAIVCHSATKLPGRATIFKNGQYHGVAAMPALLSDVAAANTWFAKNRVPAREFNAAYPKHKATQPYYDERNELVSPLNLNDENAAKAMHVAVGARGERRLLHYLKAENDFVVFSLENHPDKNPGMAPRYHGHRIDASDTVQTGRLPKALIAKAKKL